MKVTKYWKPKVDTTQLGPQIAKWTKANGDVTQLLRRFGNEDRDKFRSWQDSIKWQQTKKTKNHILK